jgi:hypothetical protein
MPYPTLVFSYPNDGFPLSIPFSWNLNVASENIFSLLSLNMNASPFLLKKESHLHHWVIHFFKYLMCFSLFAVVSVPILVALFKCLIIISFGYILKTWESDCLKVLNAFSESYWLSPSRRLMPLA